MYSIILPLPFPTICKLLLSANFEALNVLHLHTNKTQYQTTRFMSFSGVVPENPRIGSDGESEEVSDEVTSPVKLRPRNRRLSEVST